jgi:hypothetical protein
MSAARSHTLSSANSKLDYAIGGGVTAGFTVSITGSIGVTLRRSLDGGTTWVDLESEYTSSTSKNVEGPGTFRLITTSAGGGSAVCAWTK